MHLRTNGVDIFYIDESERHPLFTVSAVCVPFLREVNGKWTFVWQDYLDAATKWRREQSRKHNIRFRKELHASELLARKGLYLKGNKNLSPDEAFDLYRDALQTLDFLPDSCMLTSYSTHSSFLMGHKGVKAAFFGLFQRIRRQCGDHTNGLLFFDDGHPEYISWYRQATRYLPTGSQVGGWGTKPTKNMPLDMFPKDANIKPSDLSLFLQISDLVAYAARVKLEHERGTLQAKRVRRNHHTLYDNILKSKINLRATNKRQDGIAPI